MVRLRVAGWLTLTVPFGGLAVVAVFFSVCFSFPFGRLLCGRSEDGESVRGLFSGS